MTIKESWQDPAFRERTRKAMSTAAYARWHNAAKAYAEAIGVSVEEWYSLPVGRRCLVSSWVRRGRPHGISIDQWRTMSKEEKSQLK